MDDKKFDEILKDKIGEYSDTGSPEDALVAFRSKMAASYSVPWYVHYRGELVTAASFLLLGLLLFWGQYTIYQRDAQQMREEIAGIRDQNNELLSMLTSRNEQSGMAQNERPQIAQATDSANADARLIESLRAQLAALQSARAVEGRKSGDPEAGTQGVFIGRADEFPPEFISDLNNYFTVMERSRDLVLFVRDESNKEGIAEVERRNILTRHLTHPNFVLVPDSLPGTTIRQETRVERPIVRIPVRQQREMEQQRFQGGVGIEVGPAFSVFRAYFDPGSNERAFGGGILANFITSPTLSLETGVMLNTVEYLVKAQEFSQTELPPGDEMYGELTGVEVSPSFVDIPVNVKYRYRISGSSHLMGGAGLSAQLITREEFEYLYDFDAGSGFFIPVEQSGRNREWQWQLGTANLMLGMSTRLKNDKRLEALLFYKKSLRPLGTAGVDADFLGLRTSYYFTVR